MVKIGPYHKYHKPGTMYSSAPKKSRACLFGEHSNCSVRDCGCFCHRHGVRHVVHKKGKGHGKVFDYISNRDEYKGKWW